MRALAFTDPLIDKLQRRVIRLVPLGHFGLVYSLFWLDFEAKKGPIDGTYLVKDIKIMKRSFTHPDSVVIREILTAF